MSDTNELIERIEMFNEEILQTRIKMNNLENDQYKEVLALTELNFEIWRDIKGYVGIYQISNLGNVKNTKTLRILKACINANGYKFVSLYRDGKRKYPRIHRLIALNFIPNYENKTCVDHINNIRLDNRLKNLRFVTSQENNRNRSIGKRNTSTIKGVHFNKACNKWHAQIMFNGKSIHLGYFQNIEDAKEARQIKAKILFGEYINQCEK
jgi:hypothetical protein